MTGLALGFMLQTALLAAGPQTYEAAYRQAEVNGQPILVLVGADWCPGCQTMKRTVLPRMQRGGQLKGVNLAVVNSDEGGIADSLMRGTTIPQIIVYAKTEKGWHREQITGVAGEQGVAQLVRRAADAQRAAKIAKEREAKDVESAGGQ